MATEIDVAALRNGKPREVAIKLRELEVAHSPASITASIDSLVASGTLPVWVYRIWLTATHDGGVIVAALRQNHSSAVRRITIDIFCRALRSPDRFWPVWNAVGGAQGLAAMMAVFSVLEVKQMCRGLGRTCSANKVREERQQQLTELARLLLGQGTPDGKPAAVGRGLDPRPLRAFYTQIVPGCTDEMVVQWEERAGDTKWSKNVRTALSRQQAARYEARFLAGCFSSETNGVRVPFRSNTHLFANNPSFCEAILFELLRRPRDTSVPTDFLPSFAMPFLGYIFRRRRFDDEYRARICRLLVDCASRHESLAGKLTTVDEKSPFGLTLKLWSRVRGQQLRSVEETLQEFVEIMPAGNFQTMKKVQETLELVQLELRYQLLRLILRNAKHYKLDIDDSSDKGISRLSLLSKVDNQWPAGLFTEVLRNDSALPLFERMICADPSAMFLQADQSHHSTILNQAQSPEIGCGDPEIIHSILIRNSRSHSPENPAWVSRVERLVDERKRKSTQARDWEARAFWIMSTLRLCISSGLMKPYGEALLWARRFMKDPLVVEVIFGEKTVATKEGKDLLIALPLLDGDDATPLTESLSSLKEDINCASQILLQLMETTAMAVVEPSFQASNWKVVWQLPSKVVEERINRAGKFQERFKLTEYGVADLLWKPTIDMALGIEVKLQNQFNSVSSKPLHHLHRMTSLVLDKVARTSPPGLLAELASFWLEGMKQKLKPAYIRQHHLGDIVQVLKCLKNSDQPSLACPFVRDFVLGDEDNSAWYRELTNVGFMFTLPAQAAGEFIHAMAEAIKDKMIKQNARRPAHSGRGRDGGHGPRVPAQPLVKVTTVKMLAQILGHGLFIDPTSACDILIGLLAHARHIDMQTTIINSLFSTLTDPQSPAALRSHILNSLEDYAIPVASQLNEREPPAEANRSKAASTNDSPLPEVSEESAILRLLIDQTSSALMVEKDRRRLAQLIMTVMEKSAENNSRWIRSFLKKYDFDLGSGSKLTALPVKPGLLMLLFKHLRPYMSRTVFDMCQRFMLVNLNPPSSVAHITRVVKTNRDLLTSNAGKHWLSLYDNDEKATLLPYVDTCAAALYTHVHKNTSKLKNGVTMPMLQGLVLEIADALIAARDPSSLDRIFKIIERHQRQDMNVWNSWKAYTLPVLQQIVAKVERISRDKEWQQNPSRKPPVLPNALLLRTRMLNFPYAPHSWLAWDRKKIEPFVDEVSGLIERIAASGLPYHEEWVHLKKMMSEVLDDIDILPVALRLGMFEGGGVAAKPTLGQYLRVELASYILRTAKNPRGEEVTAMVRDMVHGWRASEVEGFRVMAIDLEASLRRNTGDKNWFFEGSIIVGDKVEEAERA